MSDITNAQTLGEHQIVESLDREFARLHAVSCDLIERTSSENLYAHTIANSASRSEFAQHHSIGERVLRSAAVIEQAFGGITANLWDDPFEWTLPEHLSSPAKVHEHLLEVESLRQRAFSSFTDDQCLLKHIAVPAGETQTLMSLLLETLLRATSYQAQAQIMVKIFSGNSPAGFII
jgi:hypothetical protein